MVCNFAVYCHQNNFKCITDILPSSSKLTWASDHFGARLLMAEGRKMSRILKDTNNNFKACQNVLLKHRPEAGLSFQIMNVEVSACVCVCVCEYKHSYVELPQAILLHKPPLSKKMCSVSLKWHIE